MFKFQEVLLTASNNKIYSLDSPHFLKTNNLMNNSHYFFQNLYCNLLPISEVFGVEISHPISI